MNLELGSLTWEDEVNISYTGLRFLLFILYTASRMENSQI
jgi:hypothetical protein